MRRSVHLRLAESLVILLWTAPAVQAQDLVKEALEAFPPETLHLEYSNSAQLRKLSDYTRLRRRYLDPRLQKFEQSLGKLGIQDADVDELVLGWGTDDSDPYGLTAGRFDPEAIASSASQAGLTPTRVSGYNAYCFSLDPGNACLVVLNDSRGAFGDLKSLGRILDARSGKTVIPPPPENHLKRLVAEVQTLSPIWGIVVAPAIADWLKSFLMPGQAPVQLDWAQALQTVEALSYTIDVRDKVTLNLELRCTTPQAAGDLRQVLEGLKTLQQLAWQNQHPNQPNPFSAVQVDAVGQRVNLKLTTPYPEG